MPTYDYECSDCGVMEIFHSIMDDVIAVCPDCGKGGFSRLISVGGGVIISDRQPNHKDNCG